MPLGPARMQSTQEIIQMDTAIVCIPTADDIEVLTSNSIEPSSMMYKAY